MSRRRREQPKTPSPLHRSGDIQLREGNSAREGEEETAKEEQEEEMEN